MNSTFNRRLNKLEEKTITSITAETRAEVARMLEAAKLKFNSPEAKAERRRLYEEQQRIGRLREQAFMSGESMEKYPVPLMNKGAGENEDIVRKIIGG